MDDAEEVNSIRGVEPPKKAPATAAIRTTGERLADVVFRLVSSSDASRGKINHENYFRQGLAEAPEFLRRFERTLDFRGKAVLDCGSGYGSLSFHLAKAEGAARVLGVDIDEQGIAFSRATLESEFKSLSNVVDFARVDELGYEQFDVIVSKNCFQHYSDPANTLSEMARRLAPGGLLLIGFGPLWRSPYGAPIDFMTRVPWAHLIFPESVIMRRRRLFRPSEQVNSYAEIRGGFNKMTLRRYEEIVRRSGLRTVSFVTNASPGMRGRMFRSVARIPGLREYFTLNLYSILAGGSAL